MKTVIVDCGGGNLRSVKNALDYLGFLTEISCDPQAMRHADRIIFPGQGHFGMVMQQLEAQGLKQVIMDCIQTKSFLGICVGMQILFETSTEASKIVGLGVFNGRVEQLPATHKLPQMGWNWVAFDRQPDLSGYYYFAHTYHCIVADREVVQATTHYGIIYTSACGKNTCWAVQFHPEKSGEKGLQFLDYFMRTPC